MADPGMFGAPIGISAAEDQINQNVRSGLLAQKTLGEIAQQPAELEMKRAHARAYDAEAAEKTAKLRDQQLMDRVSALAAAEGREPTADDLTRVDNPPSITEPFERILRIAQDVGAPARLTIDLGNKISQMTRNLAVADNNRAEEARRKLTTQKDRAGMIASMAQAALSNPAQYQQLRMDAINRGLPADRLPEAFDEKVITGLRDAGLSAKEQIERKFKELDDKRKNAAEKRMKAKSDADIALAGSRRDLVDERYKQLQKEGGPNSQSARDARTSRTETARAVAFAKLNKEYPMAPADPKLWVAGKTYRLPNGTFIQATQSDGKIGGLAIQVPDEVRRTLYGRPAGSAAAAGNDDADLEDDDAEALAD